MSEEFIREVDEELQEEKYAKIWRKIGPYVISLAIGIVLFTSGVVFWNNYTEDKKQKLGDDFTAAVELIKEEDFDTALIALERITDKASDGYVTIAKMKKASKFLIGKHDFTSFRSRSCQALNPIKTNLHKNPKYFVTVPGIKFDS